MLNKYKQFIVGIVVGAVIFGALPVGAAVQQYVLYKAPYKIIVNGAEYKDAEQPALNYNGNTYVPLRAVGKLLGQEPRWNAEKKQVELGAAQTGEPDQKEWIRAKDFHKINSEAAINLTQQIIEKNKSNTSGKNTIYKLNYEDKIIKSQLYNSISYLNITDLKAAGIYTE